MLQYVVTDTELEAVANAIRTKGGTEADLEWPSAFVSAIGAITTGGGGGGSLSKETLMTQGQVSTTSNYAASSFSSTINFSEYVYIQVDLWRDGEIVGSDIITSQGYFMLYTASYNYKMSISSSQISCIQYNGSYVNLYVDVYGIKAGTSSPTGGGGDDDEILYNHDFSKNTTGQTLWDGTNSGTSQSSRFRIIDGWEIMQCTAEKTANGLKVVPKKQYAYLTATIPAYWFLNKTVTIYAIVNGTKYGMTGALSSNGASVSYNTPFGQLYFYTYSAGDTVFTVSFYNQIDQEFVISDTSMKLATS